MTAEDIQNYLNSLGFPYGGAVNTREFLGFPPGSLRIVKFEARGKTFLGRFLDWCCGVRPAVTTFCEFVVVDPSEGDPDDASDAEALSVSRPNG